jgi:hypothetical protein
MIKFVVVGVNRSWNRSCELNAHRHALVLHTRGYGGVRRHMLIRTVLGQLFSQPVGGAALRRCLVHQVLHNILVVVRVDGDRNVQVAGVEDKRKNNDEDDQLKTRSAVFVSLIGSFESIHGESI